jgi:Bacterial Ig domain/FG-GAP-like repeat/FG-GAP repeat
MKFPQVHSRAVISLSLLMLLTVVLTTAATLPGSLKSKVTKSQPTFLQASTPVPTPPSTSAPTPTPAPVGQSVTNTGQTTQPNGNGGTLSGRLSMLPPHEVNLSTEGSVDWAHWGLNGSDKFDHKTNVSQQISNYTKIGTEPVNWLNDNPTTFSWTDGTPTASVSNTATGVHISGVANGFELTMPADTNVKTLRLYLGLWRVQGKLEAILSGGSAPSFIDNSLDNNGGTSNGVYVISFRAASSGQTLKIRYTVAASYAEGGNVTLEAATLVDGADPNTAPIVHLSGPGDESTFNPLEDITLNANAIDLDGSINEVKFYADGKLIGTGLETGSNQYSITWNDVFAGTYTLTVTAKDNDGAIEVSSPKHIRVFSGSGGSLSGEMSVSSSSEEVNLTAEGTIDWAHWGLNGSTSFNHKNSIPQQISDSSLLGTSPPNQLTDNATTFSWSDGTPTTSANNTQTGIFLNGAMDNGFEITVPADTSIKTLKVHIGAWYAQGRFEATLSDGSAPVYLDTSLDGHNGSRNAVYTIAFRAASGGQKLRIRYTLLINYFAPYGNITLEAATLIAGGDDSNAPPTVSLTSPVSGSTFVAPANVILTANAVDADGSISKVEFYSGLSKIGEALNEPYSFTWNGVPAGSYSLTARAIDNAGTVATSSTVSITVIAGGTSPVISSLSPTSGPIGTLVRVSGQNFGSVQGTSTISFNGLIAPLTPAPPPASTLVFGKSSDFDGDGKDDIATWSPANGHWVIVNSSDNSVRTQQWGINGDSLVPSDYDGDGKTDVAIYRPSEGNWYIINSATGGGTIRGWGDRTDRLVPGDYDGDDKTDIAVWRPTEGNWYILQSTNNVSIVKSWGENGDTPVPGDYDGDGKCDIAVWRPSDGNWYIINSNGGTTAQIQWGLQGDIPLPGDYDGDGKTDAAVWRPSDTNWYIRYSSNIPATIRNWGDATDRLVPADYDGDGKTDIAIWRPTESNWYIIQSSTGTVRLQYQGAGSDTPIPFISVTPLSVRWSNNHITVLVPEGATTGPVVVTVNGVASNGIVFTVGTSLDTDADGLPDSWEIQYFGNLNQTANGDPDGDGATNLQEFLQGRNPTKGAIIDTGGVLNLKVYTPLEPSQP